jgi:hypothetical protein
MSQTNPHVPPPQACKPRFFIGLVEVAGYYRGLKHGFEASGHHVTFVNLENHRFAYGGDDAQTPFVQWIRQTQAKKGKLWRALNQLGRLCLMLWAIQRHDVFIFASNTSFLQNQRDLKWLKRFGKTLIFQYHGSDDRPPYLDGSAMAPDKHRSIQTCIEMTRRKKETLKRIEQHADYLISIPPQGHLHERPFIQWLRLGLPIIPQGFPNIPQVEPSQPLPQESNETVTILHCPSHPQAKGSDVIRQVVRDLQTEGYRIHLTEIVNQPNRVVCEALADCDIVIDQLYADYGMASFATEAAWFGKPVIVGGYPADLWSSWLPAESLPPTVYIHPDALKSTLVRLIEHPEERRAIGDRLNQFVENQWSTYQVASRYCQLVAGDIPADWWVDPQSIRYWQGCCLKDDTARQLIGHMIALGGVQSLCLSDKPDLEKLLVEVAHSASSENRHHLMTGSTLT